MKYRTDFVTNSSDSSFVTVNVNNPALQKRLEELGIRISGNGVFNYSGNADFFNETSITLPSGKRFQLHFWDGYRLRVSPYQFQSISAWLINSFFEEGCIDEDDWDDEEEKNEDDTGAETDEELKQLFRDHGLMNEEEDLSKVLEDAFGPYDANIVSAEYEYCYGFEGEVESADHFDIKDGVRASYDCSYDIPDVEIQSQHVYIFDFPCTVFASKEEIAEKVTEEGGILVEDLASADIAIIGTYGSDAFDLARNQKNVSFAISEKAFARLLDDE